ncbi:MAG: DUF1211 domain-containing protein [Acidobacteria bacterium]|nr:DUF1211 domain-containing protein [Acidobacteriota bacterium]
MAKSPVAAGASSTASLTAFRNRAGEITRLEALSDGTFAFAITLLVVSLEVPSTFAELEHALRGFLAFGVCFTMLIWVWFQHTRFFRRYGLEDAVTVALNGLLLFVVLFYVYPLKFLWTYLAGTMTGRVGGAPDPVERAADGQHLMQIYGLGFAAIFFSLALLYVRAYLLRRTLQLNRLEEFDTRSGVLENLSVCLVGILSILIVTVGGGRYAFLSGICYGLIGPVKAYHGYWHGKTRAHLEKNFLIQMEPTVVGTPKFPLTGQ